MSTETRKELEEITEALEELQDRVEAVANGIERRTGNVFSMRLRMVQQIVRAGLIDVFQEGDDILNLNDAFTAPIRWRVIGKNRDGENTLTLWAVDGFGEMRFDEESEAYPFGHALWRDSALRKKLNGEIMAGFAPEDAAAIQPMKVVTYAPAKDGGEAIETEDCLWPLSMSQAGLGDTSGKDEGAAYPYLENEENRQIGDWWWSRSAFRGYAHAAWTVHSSGNAYSYYYATYAYRPAPACVIR